MALHPREVRPPGQASIRGKWGLGLQQASRLWRTGLPACKPASQHQPACSTGRERGSGPPPGRPAHLLGGGEGPPGNGVCAGGGGLAVRVALTAVAAANVGGSVQVGQGCGRAGQGGGGVGVGGRQQGPGRLGTADRPDLEAFALAAVRIGGGGIVSGHTRGGKQDRDVAAPAGRNKHPMGCMRGRRAPPAWAELPADVEGAARRPSRRRQPGDWAI